MLNVALNPNLPPFSSRNCTTTASSFSLVLVPSTFRTHVSYRQSYPSPSKLLFTGPSHGSLFSSSLRFGHTHFDFYVVSGRAHSRFKVGALRKRRKGSKLGVEGLERNGKVTGYGGGDDDDEEEEEWEEEEDGDEEDEEGMYSPFEKMTKWHENKPVGFGVGKVYDTSIEDELLEEMHHSRVAQAANINKLKNNPVTPTTPRKDEPHLEVAEAPPSGIPVRVVNLPKKKNIHRDLKMAFNGVDGITGIHPTISGNKKTRDPICTGFAFIYFKSEEHAMSFVQTFSRQSLTFGKVQKQIKCEMMSSRLPVRAKAESARNTLVRSENGMLDMEGEQDLRAEVYESTSDFLEDVTSEKENDWNDEIELDEIENRKDMETSDITFESGTKIVTASSSTEQRGKVTLATVAAKQKKPRPNPKKPAGKGKAEKVFKLEVPGSAKRLRVKEKALLTGVLSKYGGKAALTSNDNSVD